jgi:hypothetical protein
MASRTRKSAEETGGAAFCVNCGQPVEGRVAELAANRSAAFCCECGVRLTTAGTCRNRLCPFFEMVPECT